MSPRQPKQRSYALQDASGSKESEITRVAGSLVIGRTETCDIVIQDRNVSRRHCKLFLDSMGNLVLQDLNSHNGTYVDGERVIRSILTEGSGVRIGGREFEVIEFETVQPARLEGAQLVKEANTVSLLPSLQEISSDEHFSATSITPQLQDRGEEQRFTQLSQHVHQFAALLEISQILQREQNADLLLTDVMVFLLQITGGTVAYVALLDEADALVPRAVVNRHGTKPSTEEHAFQLSKTVADYVIQQRCGVIISDTLGDDRFATSDSLHSGALRSLIAVPILVGQRALGLIAACNDASIEDYSEHHLDLLCVAASMVGPALQNIELAQQREEHIEQLKRAQQELINAQAQLVQSEKMAAIGRFSSGIMHEVKNHLSPLMLADMVASAYPDDEDLQDMSEMLLEARTRILELIDEIRRFARGDQSTYNFRPSDLAEVAEKVVRFVKCDAAFQQVHLALEKSESLVVEMDEDRIRQVLINLLRNAAEATGEDPRVRLRLSRLEGIATIEVEDNGRGIPPEIGEKIFESLFTTKGDNGIGLGLEISRRIVEAHQGTLTFASEPGQTIFTMRLPLTQGERSTSEASEAAPTEPFTTPGGTRST